MAASDAYEHEPVMVAEALRHLRPEVGGWFLDGTLGGGGHAEALLEAGPEARLVGLDLDPAALEAAGERLAPYGDRVRLIQGSFREAPTLAGRALSAEREGGPEGPPGWDGLAGALLDLGVSSPQLDETARGFSFRPGTPLNMRMGGTTGGRGPAAELLNTASEEALGRVFREFGEERRWRRLAAEVVRRRREAPFEISDDLVAAIEAALGPRADFQDKARIFQAVRIAVNDELTALEEGLEEIRELLRPGGRLVVIAYHSLEDRLVKNAFREWSRGCICPPELPVCLCRGEPLGRTLTRKPERPSQEEVARNPRSRSARLRAWERA